MCVCNSQVDVDYCVYLTHFLINSAGEDYIGVTNFSLTFNFSNRVNIVDLKIINDNAVEDIETLQARISLLTPPFANQRVIVAPNSTLVHIHDNDGKVLAT